MQPLTRALPPLPHQAASALPAEAQLRVLEVHVLLAPLAHAGLERKQPARAAEAEEEDGAGTRPGSRGSRPAAAAGGKSIGRAGEAAAAGVLGGAAVAATAGVKVAAADRSSGGLRHACMAYRLVSSLILSFNGISQYHQQG